MKDHRGTDVKGRGFKVKRKQIAANE